MNIHSDKINCYLEGIRVPIVGFKVFYKQNKLSSSIVTLPIGTVLHPKMWASAVVQITYLDHNYIGEMSEKLLYEGWCTGLEVMEQTSSMNVFVESRFNCLNYNTTLDYVAPKRYGLQKLDEGIIIYMGNEEDISISSDELGTGWTISERYMYLADESDDLEGIDVSSTEKEKLYYIINRRPLAEKFANSFFDQIAYSNFSITKAPVDRLNILAKIDPEESQRDEASYIASERTTELSLGIDVGFDITRTNVRQYFLSGKHETESETFQSSDFKGDVAAGAPHGLAAIKQMFGEPGVEANTTSVSIPGGVGGGQMNLTMHKRLAEPFKKMFDDLKAAGLGKHITDPPQSYSNRVKNTLSGPSSQKSTHAWPIAFDINIPTNGLGVKPTEAQKALNQHFSKYGWHWGAYWKSNPDPMHFQYCTGY